jgi:UDP-N-acetylmuramoyl-L-alanyl-D-glutamate--2,6-diaminopimelate ligase
LKLHILFRQPAEQNDISNKKNNVTSVIFNELITLCDPIEVSGPQPEGIGPLAQDSRKVEPGSVFIAVKGTQVDGHAFIDNAIEKGASVIICENKIYTEASVCIVRVANTRALIGPLAQAFEGNPAENLTIIGITGTNGKTTVATLAYQVLQSLNVNTSLLGTVAKRIGDEVIDSRLTTSDPIELAADMRRMTKAESTHLVMEVSSHAIDQQRTAGVAFDVAAFTNLSHDHLDYHPSEDAYASTKKRLFDELPDGATAIINNDDDQASFMVSDCSARIVPFSFEGAGTVDQANAEQAIINCSIKESNAGGLTIDIEGTVVQSPMAGRFNAYNVAQAFLICRVLGFEDTNIAAALGSAAGAAGRLQRVQIEDQADQPLVLVDYAHTPGALENVLQSLATTKQDNQSLHVIFGCGGDRDATKRPKMAGVAEDNADLVTITSDNPRSEDPDAIIDDAMKGFIKAENIRRITDRRKAIEQAIADADEHMVILIAGKGHETYQEIKGTRHAFDDRTIAREALANRKPNPKSPEVR